MSDIDFKKYLFSYKFLFVNLILYLLLMLYSLTTTSRVFFLVFDFIKVSIFSEVINSSFNYIDLFVNLISLFTSFYLLFILHSLITAVSTYNAYEIAARKYSFERPVAEDVFFKTLSWNFYRLVYVLSPFLSILVVSGLLIILNLFLFKGVLYLAGISIGFVTFVTSFILIGLVISLFLAAGISVYNIFITLFGIECAVSEPSLDNNVIRKRSKKLSLIKKSNVKIYILYSIFILTLLIQYTGVFLFPEVLSKENLIIVAVLAIIDIVFFIGLGYLKSSLYIDSLLYQYNRITFKDKNALSEIVCEI